MKAVKLSVNYFLKRANIIILIKRVAYRGMCVIKKKYIIKCYKKVVIFRIFNGKYR